MDISFERFSFFVDKIDFAAIRPTLEPELLAAIRDVVDPMELRRIIAPKIYKLRAGCAVNVMQRLVSGNFPPP